MEPVKNGEEMKTEKEPPKVNLQKSNVELYAGRQTDTHLPRAIPANTIYYNNPNLAPDNENDSGGDADLNLDAAGITNSVRYENILRIIAEISDDGSNYAFTLASKFNNAKLHQICNQFGTSKLPKKSSSNSNQPDCALNTPHDTKVYKDNKEHLCECCYETIKTPYP